MMKKIAILTDGIYPYVLGGMQRHSYYLCKYLARKGIKIDLYHTDSQHQYDIEQLEFFSDDEKAHINSIVLDFPKEDRLPGHYLRNSRKYAQSVYENFLKFSSDSDFVYIKGFSGWEYLYQKKNGAKLPPAGINFHGYEMFQIQANLKGELQKYMLRPAIRFNVSAADVIFSYGGKITEIIKSIGTSENKIIEIPTGIEESWISQDSLSVTGKRKFVFLGRNERRKGIEELNKILQPLCSDFDFLFDFIGPIPLSKQIQQEQIRYQGTITDQHQLKNALSKADILVCPSYSEGMPNVITEAMARGCGIIATDVGAISAMVGIQNGWLIPPKDPVSLKNAIISAIEINDDELLKMKRNSMNIIKEKFLWTDLIDQTVERITSYLETTKLS